MYLLIIYLFLNIAAYSKSNSALEHSDEIRDIINSAVEDINQKVQQTFEDKINILKQRLDDQIYETKNKIGLIRDTPDFKKFLSYLQDNNELSFIEENIKQETTILKKLKVTNKRYPTLKLKTIN